MPWPSPEAVAAVTRPIPYESPGPWDGGAHCAGSRLPGTARLAAFLETLPGVESTGGYTCRRNTANANEMSVHGTGRAIDVMIPKIDGAANPAGDAIADWLVANANLLGVQLVIWDRVIWNSERRTARPYTGPSSHTDHIHMELTNAAANGAMDALPAFGVTPEETKARGGVALLLLGVAAAAATWVLWPRKGSRR